MLPTAALMATVACLPLPVVTERHLCQRDPRSDVSPVDQLAERWRAEAVEWRDCGRAADSLPLFNAALRLKPDDYYALIGRGKAFAALGRFDEQADDYHCAARLVGERAEFWHDVAVGWLARGSVDEAAACFDYAVGLTTNVHNRRLTLLAQMMAWVGKDERAVQIIRSQSGWRHHWQWELSDIVGIDPRRLVKAQNVLMEL